METVHGDVNGASGRQTVGFPSEACRFPRDDPAEREIAGDSAYRLRVLLQSLLGRHARERQLCLLRRPSTNAVRLHVNLMHLLALAGAVFIRPFEACRFDLAPRRHATAHLGRDGVVSIAGRRDFRDRRACRKKS
jgi:hypothetical protein